MICEAQCKMQIGAPGFKKNYRFQESYSRALNQTRTLLYMSAYMKGLSWPTEVCRFVTETALTQAQFLLLWTMRQPPHLLSACTLLWTRNRPHSAPSSKGWPWPIPLPWDRLTWHTGTDGFLKSATLLRNQQTFLHREFIFSRFNDKGTEVGGGPKDLFPSDYQECSLLRYHRPDKS